MIIPLIDLGEWAGDWGDMQGMSHRRQTKRGSKSSSGEEQDQAMLRFQQSSISCWEAYARMCGHIAKSECSLGPYNATWWTGGYRIQNNHYNLDMKKCIIDRSSANAGQHTVSMLDVIRSIHCKIQDMPVGIGWYTTEIFGSITGLSSQLWHIFKTVKSWPRWKDLSSSAQFYLFRFIFQLSTAARPYSKWLTRSQKAN